MKQELKFDKDEWFKNWYPDGLIREGEIFQVLIRIVGVCGLFYAVANIFLKFM